MARIRTKAEAYGICRIVPPASWKPPCPLKEKIMWENSKFATRIQRIDKLQNRDSMRRMWEANIHKKKKRRRCLKPGVDLVNGSVDNRTPGEAAIFDAERFGFEPGPEFTLDSFQKYADDFKAQYFRQNEGQCPSLENIEGEYWRMVEKPSEEIEVAFFADYLFIFLWKPSRVYDTFLLSVIPFSSFPRCFMGLTWKLEYLEVGSLNTTIKLALLTRSM